MLKAVVVGNIGSDPEARYSQAGSSYLRFNVASNGRVKDQSGNWVDETTWVRVTVFGQRADALGQHLKKGMRVYVDGRLEARPWTDNAGTVRAGLELTANDVEFFSPRQSDDPMTPRNTVNQQPRQQAPRAQEYMEDSDLESLPF